MDIEDDFNLVAVLQMLARLATALLTRQVPQTSSI